MNTFLINAQKVGPRKLDPSVMIIIQKIIGNQPMNHQMAEGKASQLRELFPRVNFNIVAIAAQPPLQATRWQLGAYTGSSFGALGS